MDTTHFAIRGRQLVQFHWSLFVLIHYSVFLQIQYIHSRFLMNQDRCPSGSTSPSNTKLIECLSKPICHTLYHCTDYHLSLIDTNLKVLPTSWLGQSGQLYTIC